MQEHEDLVRRLAKPGNDILSGLTAGRCHLLHMAVGVAGEAGELLDAIRQRDTFGHPLGIGNVTKELGDLEFFLEGLRAYAGIVREVPVVDADGQRWLSEVASTLDLAIGVSVASSNILDVVKKHVIYGKALGQQALEKSLLDVELHLEYLRRHSGLTREHTLQVNIDKLTKRYGSDYSDKAAIERADKGQADG